MPTIDIIQIEDLGSAIATAIKQVNDGVAMARSQGIQAEIPKAIDFQVNVVVKWQDPALPMASGESATTTETGGYTETQGGGSKTVSSERQTGDTTETSAREEDSIKAAKSTKNGTSNNIHTQTDVENITQTDDE